MDIFEWNKVCYKTIKFVLSMKVCVTIYSMAKVSCSTVFLKLAFQCTLGDTP